MHLNDRSLNAEQGEKTEKPEISIVMPCLNEAETLEVCIRKAGKSLEAHNLRGEIIVADNGSTDGSQEIAARNGARVIPVERKGYGAALIGGIDASNGSYIIMGDADDSYDFGNIFPFVEKLREGYDLVMGCRLPAGGGTIMPGAMPFKHRYLGNPVLSNLGRLFFKTDITDFHCGLRGFSKESFKKMDLHTTGMEFASEMVVKASLNKMRIHEIPITLHEDGRTRKPHLRSWRDGWRHLRFLLLYAPKWLFFLPGFLCLMAGLVTFIPLSIAPVTLFGIAFDTNTLLISALLMLFGVQLIHFYFFTWTFAITEGLLPSEPLFDRLFAKIRLETGILLGLFLLILGFTFISVALGQWYAGGFGLLSYPISLRKVIPGVVLSLIGLQTVFFSFFMSILGLPRK